MSGVTGDFSKLSKLAKGLPTTAIAQRTAARVAPAITAAARSSFASGKNPYGDAWEPGKNGKTVTLRKSGALFGSLRFVAIGTRVRAVLGVRYAKFQVGRRKVLPRGGSAMPIAWSDGIATIAGDEIKRALGEL